MPRDLEALAKEDGVRGMPPITKSPDNMEHRPTLIDMDLEDEEAMINALSQRNEKRDELHPYTQTLKESDIASCVKLEEATFPPDERCTREKFAYRLKTCGELSLGIFTSDDTATSTIPTALTAAPVYSGAPARKAVLLGHIIATKSLNPTVRDEDMEIPAQPSSTTTGASASVGGHQESGRTLCIHSLAVLPDFQKRGLGKTLLKSYLQRMESQGVAERVALIARQEMVGFYEALGFAKQGESGVQFAGGGWFDMVKELRGESSEESEEF